MSSPKEKSYSGFKLPLTYRKDVIRKEMVRDIDRMYSTKVEKILSQPHDSSIHIPIMDKQSEQSDSEESFYEQGEFSKYLHG